MCEYEVQKAQKNKLTISCAPDTSKEDEILLLRRQLVERDGLIETKTQIIEQHFQTIQELKSELVELNETIGSYFKKTKLIKTNFYFYFVRFGRQKQIDSNWASNIIELCDDGRSC